MESLGKENFGAETFRGGVAKVVTALATGGATFVANFLAAGALVAGVATLPGEPTTASIVSGLLVAIPAALPGARYGAPAVGSLFGGMAGRFVDTVTPGFEAALERHRNTFELGWEGEGE